MQRSPLFLTLALLLGLTAPAAGWHTGGHSRVALAAVELLPDSMPESFRQQAELIGHLAIDPDLMKHRETDQVREAESPEHYIDLELLEGHRLFSGPDPLPDRYRFIAHLIESGQDPAEVGMVPYATIELTQRLALAFAQQRARPDDPLVRRKTAFYAGLLAHYAADMVQPLHTTVDYDGRLRSDGSSPHTGLHNLVDSLFDRLDLDAEDATGSPGVIALNDLPQRVERELRASHSLVRRVYRLEDKLFSDGEPAGRVARFGRERFRRAALFIATLYRSAWVGSADLRLAPWFEADREPEKASP